MMTPKDMPLANIGNISDELRKEIILIENQNIINISTKRDMRINYDLQKVKERDYINLDKELASNDIIDIMDTNDNTDKKRPRSEEEASETNKKVDTVPKIDSTNYPDLKSSNYLGEQDTTA